MVLSLLFTYLILSAHVGQHVETSVSRLDGFGTICLQRKNMHNWRSKFINRTWRNCKTYVPRYIGML